MQHENLVAATHAEMLTSRNLYYLVQSSQFSELYNEATQAERDTVIGHIEKRDVTGLHTWMAQQRHQRFDIMTVRELRKLAQLRRIPEYHLMGKFELIVELRLNEDENT